MSRRICVLQVVRPSAGGMKKHVQGLIQGLNRDRFEVFLAAPEDEACIQWAARQGIGYVPLEISDQVLALSDVPACVELRKLIKTIQPDICHFHGFKAAAIGRVAVALCSSVQVSNCVVSNCVASNCVVLDAPHDATRARNPKTPKAVVAGCSATNTQTAEEAVDKETACRKLSINAPRVVPWTTRWTAPQVVYTVHNSVLSRSGMQGKMCLYAERALARFTHRVITVSKALCQEYTAISGLGSGKVRYIPNGIELKPFCRMASSDNRQRESAKSDMGCAAITPVVGLVSRLIPHKGIKTFLLAMVSLKQMGFAPQVIIAGDGPFRDELEAFTLELGLGNQVRFLGFIEDMASFYSALDVFVLSSLSEGMPLSVIEAMVSGVPVVATRTGGVEDVVTQGAGRLVPPGDSESMAACIRDVLLYPEESRNLAHKARLNVRERFSLEEMIRKTEEVYEEVLACPNSKDYQ